MSKISKQFNYQSIAIILIIAIFFVSDRLLKTLALSSAIEPAKVILPNFFLFNFTENYQIAFSLPVSGPWLNWLIFTLIVSLFITIIKLIFKEKHVNVSILLLTFILFGAISNMFDRYRYGFVIDYLELKNFTVFNLADIMISLGSLFFLIINIFNEQHKKVNLSNEEKRN